MHSFTTPAKKYEGKRESRVKQQILSRGTQGVPLQVKSVRFYTWSSLTVLV